jgi:uncharacterized membrane protein YphA (DoxX/SURF4 family)
MNPPSTTGKWLRTGLWIAQIVVFAIFVAAGYMKFTTPIPELSKMMPWTGDVPVRFVRFIGIIDMAGGLGVLLPTVTRVLPGVTVFAALGCTILQVFAIGFHVSRGEFIALPLNAVLLPLVIFIFWGRRRTASSVSARSGVRL